VLTRLKSFTGRVLRFFVSEDLQSFGTGPHRFTTDRQLQEALRDIRRITDGDRRPAEGETGTEERGSDY
jgi:hypothetical protein